MKKNLLLSLLSTLIFIFLLEGVAYLSLGTLIGPTFSTYLTYDKNRGWKLRPNFKGIIKHRAKGFSFDVHISSSGFRIDSGMKNITNKKESIVILGDSNAFGFGLNGYETLAAQLSTSLKKYGISLGVLNAGVPGYDILQTIIRLKAIEIKEKMLFLFLVHPVNDIVNSGNDIDYAAYKPYVFKKNGGIAIEKPLRSFVSSKWHFSRDFDDLNQFFDLPNNKTSLFDRATELSILIYIIRYRKNMIFFNDVNESEQIVWYSQNKEKYVETILKRIEKDPKHIAARFWPEITELQSYRARLINYVGTLYSNVLRYTSKRGANICVILATEPYRTTEFYIKQTDLLQSLLPHLHFDWGSTAHVLYLELKKRGIPTLIIDYKKSDSIEKMFIPLDSHKSAAAYRKMSDEVVNYYLSQVLRKNKNDFEGKNL